MKAKVALMVLFLGIMGIVNAIQSENIVLVDTLYAELSLTNSIFHNMLTDTYMYVPNYTSLEIRYGRNSFGNPGIVEARGVVSFHIPPLPMGYNVQSTIFQANCEWYWDNSNEDIWPHYYSTPYQVLLDHIQFDSISPAVFGQNALSPNVAVLQDSAYIGWVTTDVTNSYVDDVQQSRTYSQYRLHFPLGYDVVGYEADYIRYGRLDWGTPKLIITYQKNVSNSDDISPPVSSLIKRLYPLPVRGVLHIELEDKYYNAASIYLYDLKGRLVELYDDLNFQNDPIQFQLPDCPSGIYYMKVESGLKKEIRRITILK
jgi:hypothetical protein